MNESLILADKQLQLFDSSQMDSAFFAAEESKRPPSFTGARLLKFRPDSYKHIVDMSAEGISAADIAKIEEVSESTVYAVRRRNRQQIEVIKLQLAGLSFEAAEACVEGIADMRINDPERWRKMSAKDKAISFGIMVDKGLLLSGSPTARLQIMLSDPPDYDEYLILVQEQFEGQKKPFSIGLGEGKEKQRANQGDVIEGELVPAEEEIGPCKDVGPGVIVDPGEVRDIDSEWNHGKRAEQAPEGSVGQTPHRQDDMPVNIDRNEGAQKATCSVTLSDLENCEASA